MLEKYNYLFEVDKNKIYLNCSNQIIFYLRKHIDFEWSNDQMNKVSYWLNSTRHKEDPKESFEREFCFNYDQFPDHFKDFNLNHKVYPDHTMLNQGKQFKEYIYDKTLQIMDILSFPDLIDSIDDNYIIKNKTYGEIDFNAFLMAFADTSRALYQKNIKESTIKNNNGQIHLLDQFSKYALVNSKKVDSKYKASNLALMIEIFNNIEQLKKQKMVS